MNLVYATTRKNTQRYYTTKRLIRYIYRDWASFMAHKVSRDFQDLDFDDINRPFTHSGQMVANKLCWDAFQNKGTRTSPARLSFVLKVPLRYLRPSIIYSVPCDWIAQRAYWYNNHFVEKKKLPNHGWIRFHFRDTIGYHSNSITGLEKHP